MVSLLRPEGPSPEHAVLTRRGALGLASFAGYAAFAVSAAAQPIRTPETGLVAESVYVRTRDGQIPAYVARPAARGRHPVVVVISEVFGLHEYIRDVTRRLAQAGYAAIAPDFFARVGDPAPLTDFARIREIVGTATNEQVMSDLAATLAYLRAQPYADARRAGITGFCWGGAVVWMACSRFRDFDAGVAWYGRLSRPAPTDFLGAEERPWPLDTAHALNAPVLGLYAGRDRGIPLDTVERMRAELREHRKRGSEIVVYPEAQHGFHADYRDSYDRAAAEDGWRRLLAHFDRHVKARRGLFG